MLRCLQLLGEIIVKERSIKNFFYRGALSGVFVCFELDFATEFYRIIEQVFTFRSARVLIPGHWWHRSQEKGFRQQVPLGARAVMITCNFVPSFLEITFRFYWGFSSQKKYGVGSKKRIIHRRDKSTGVGMSENNDSLELFPEKGYRIPCHSAIKQHTVIYRVRPPS